ncbi:gluconokinase [Streptomyces sp. JJ38]|uniref:gluconokinase n=1 Tax=Streptomyces sp. JJ38 TaxID=2738128 RepID=UPI001C55DC85|nr:gluconokinase [Streptomyces sp. JJ38]MBW1599862.1 gluconokinase [Streptomyces sp. JJ38]
MGVSGSGKTTVGTLLARRLGLPYAEGDAFHPPGNVAKMAAGTPLTDEDRVPWLEAVAEWLAERSGTGGVVACSALRRRYRDRLRAAAPGVFFVHLDAPREVIARRLAERRGHVMPPSLLRSQFAALEPLDRDEPGTDVPADTTPEETVNRVLADLPP